MPFRVAILSTLASLLFGATLAAQQFIPLPAGAMAMDVTPDGSVVVGIANGGGFIWRWRVDPAPTIVPGGTMVAVSDDGLVVAGTIVDPTVNAEVAAIWTQATGWQSLGWLPNAMNCPSRSNSYAISGDGTTVVGLSWDGCSGRGFRWTAATGMQQLQNLANGNNRCSAISRDGSTMGGFAQGTFNRTPAFWGPGTSGFVLDPNFQGEVYGFNNDGSLSVGTNYFSGSSYSAFIRDKQTGIMLNLGQLNSGWAGNAKDISENGKVVVGFDSLMLAIEAWVWTPSDGIISLNNRLAALGVTGVPPLGSCTAVSDDGNVIVGGGGFTTGFIVQMSNLLPFGTGTPGCTGPEVLSGSPAPKVNTPSFALSCTNAPPSSLGLWLFMDAADFAGSDPFAIGAKLHVDLFAATTLIGLNGTSDPTGLGTCAAPIPSTPTLAGATLYAQALWAWPLSVCNNLPFGLSSSNGLAITFLP